MKGSIKNPSHYELFGENTIHIVAHSLTVDEWRGFCKGNVLKYRIRAGKKGDAENCLSKADNFEALFDEHKSKCVDYVSEPIVPIIEISENNECFSESFKKLLKDNPHLKEQNGFGTDREPTFTCGGVPVSEILENTTEDQGSTDDQWGEKGEDLNETK